LGQYTRKSVSLKIVGTECIYNCIYQNAKEGGECSEHVAAHVDRKSRYLIASKLSTKKSSAMADKTIALFHKIPRVFRKPLNLDNGKEFAEFKKIAAITGLDIYSYPSFRIVCFGTY
jgi:hypothetical protein